MKDETLRSKPANSKGEGGGEPADPSSNEGNEKGFSAKEKAGFQRALQERSEKLREREAEVARLRKELKQLRMANMSGQEAVQAELEETYRELIKVKLENFARKEVEGRNLPRSLKEMIVSRPWAFVSEVKEDATPDEVVESVKSYLKPSLDSLEKEYVGKLEESSAEEESSEELPKKEVSESPTDAERTALRSGKKKVWSRREIANMDEATYAKYEKDIDLAAAEGRIVP